MRTSVQRGGLGLTGIILVLAALVALSARAGGPVSWYVTNGVSMLPEISKGTLVVVHRKASYEVGDVVAYRSEKLNSTVLHRVAGFEGDRMVMKGDNNDFLDPELPLPSDALGSRVLQVPRVGAALRWLSRPWVLGTGAVLVALALVVASPAGQRRRRSRGALRREGGSQPAPAAPGGAPPTALGRLRVPQASQGVETAFRVGIGCSLLLATAATAGPFLQTAPPGSEAARTITWDYTAPAKQGLAYPEGVVTPEDLIYTRLAPRAEVSAELGFFLPDDVTVTGTWHLEVAVRTSTGWTKRTSTGRPATIDERTERLTTPVSFVELLDLRDRVDSETGVDSGQLQVLVTAVMRLEIDDDGEVIEKDAASVLSFTADWTQIVRDGDSPLVQPTALPLAEPQEERTLELVGMSLPAGTARTGALAVAALGALALGAMSAGRRFEDEDETIRRTAGDLLVPADPACDPEQVVDVATFAALRGLAQRYDRVVLYADAEGLRFYFVLDDGIAYRYYSEERAARLDAARSPAEPLSADDQQAPSLPPIPLPRQAADDEAAHDGAVV